MVADRALVLIASVLYVREMFSSWLGAESTGLADLGARPASAAESGEQRPVRWRTSYGRAAMRVFGLGLDRLKHACFIGRGTQASNIAHRRRAEQT